MHQDEDFAIEGFINKVDPEISNEITSILMDDERYQLDNWKRKNIFPKDLDVAQLVSETILSLRCFLIDQKVEDIKQETKKNKDNTKTFLEEVRDYSNLKMLLSRKLNRVL